MWVSHALTAGRSLGGVCKYILPKHCIKFVDEDVDWAFGSSAALEGIKEVQLCHRDYPGDKQGSNFDIWQTW